MLTKAYGMIKFRGILYDSDNLQSVVLAVMDMEIPGWDMFDLYKKLKDNGIFMSIGELLPLYKAAKEILACDLTDQL